MANVSRETVSRALGALVRAGVVSKDGRRLLVQDPEVLKRLASGEIGLDNIPNPPDPLARKAPGLGVRRLVVQLQPRVIRRTQPSDPD